MGRSVEDLELAARVVFGKTHGSHTNPGCDPAPLPYREVALPEKLRFGYYLSDGFIKVSPADQRAVRETVAALRNTGHECVPFQVPQVTDAMECYMHLIAADRFKTLTSDLGDDPVEYAEWIKRCDDYRRLFTQQVWNRHNFDGLITPVLALPAMPHDLCRFLAPFAGSTALYNVLGLPVGVVPVTHVRAHDDAASAAWTDARVGAGHGSPLLERLLYGWPLPVLLSGGHGGWAGYYDAGAMAGVPVGVQVVGRQWEEERVVEMMKAVDHALGPRDFGPFCWCAQGA